MGLIPKRHRKVDARGHSRASHRRVYLTGDMHLAGYHRHMPLIGVSLRGVHLTDVYLIGISNRACIS
jgi:hypothetical protein